MLCLYPPLPCTTSTKVMTAVEATKTNSTGMNQHRVLDNAVIKRFWCNDGRETMQGNRATETQYTGASL